MKTEPKFKDGQAVVIKDGEFTGRHGIVSDHLEIYNGWAYDLVINGVDSITPMFGESHLEAACMNDRDEAAMHALNDAVETYRKCVTDELSSLAAIAATAVRRIGEIRAVMSADDAAANTVRQETSQVCGIIKTLAS